MPIYEYMCKECLHRFEELLKLDDPDPPCPECGKKTNKIVSRSSFHLKGTGWYKTDCASVDTNYVKIGVYKFSEGDTTFCDSTTVLANTSWTRFVLKGAGLAKITRWNDFIIHMKFASRMITRRAIVAGIRIYWKEGS